MSVDTFSNARMRCFRSTHWDVQNGALIPKEGPLVWILEHELVPVHALGKDWRNYDLPKLADDFRKLVTDKFSPGTNPGTIAEPTRLKEH